MRAHPALRLLPAVAGVAILVSSGCGSSSGQAGTDADISVAGWVALDLERRGLVPYLEVPADFASDRWRTTMVLFRRLEASGTGVGRPISDPVTESDERPRQSARVPLCWMAVRELSRDQWLRMGGDNAWMTLDPVDTTTRTDGFALPATGMSPGRAQAVLAAASPAGWRLEIPLDSEWEYACLAGGTTKFSWGDNMLAAPSLEDPAEYAVTLEGQPAAAAQQGPRPIGALKPNAFGLQDMHGNVWELTRVDATWQARGGAWDQAVLQSRASNRMSVPADQPTYNVGIRPVLHR